MRGQTGSARQDAQRTASTLLQGESLKVVSMLDLARELTGEKQETPVPQPQNPSEYWMRKLAGWTSPTTIPVTIPPSPATNGVHVCSTTMSAGAAQELRRITAELGVPLGTAIAASWALLLHRYSGEEDIVFGLVTSCFEQDEAVVPHIVPSRHVLKPQGRIRAWLKDVAEQAREAAPFEFISLSQISAAAGLQPDAPLFHSILSVGNDFDPASIADDSLGSTRKYPVVAAAYLGREVSLTIAVSSARFSMAAAELMIGHWVTLLESMAAAEEEPLSALRMATAKEVHRLTVEWNHTRAPYPNAVCIPQLFEQQVERTPNSIAVQFDKRSLTYAELNSRANSLAHHLRTVGVAADTVVAICMPRSIEAVLAILAVLKAGAAYLPLDPAYPKERLEYMLADSKALALITQKPLLDTFDQRPEHVVLLDEHWFDRMPGLQRNLLPVTTPSNLAYIIYTSGSTGKPKGVAMVHRALVNLIDWQVKDSTLSANERTLQFTSLSFDVSFQEIFGTWCSGGTLVLITADLRLNPRALWKFIVEQQIARIFLPFVALQQLADAAASEHEVALALKEVVTAGEQLQVTPRLRECFARHPHTTLHNHYGPSETHVVTALRLKGDPSAWPALPSIGRPVQNASIYLLDPHRSPVPVGIPGELYIGGDCLARGYFQRPEVTSEKFVPDPFGETSGARLYRTGDLARFLPNGEIEFLGRIDHQVKIRGYRVELGEVETAVSKLAGVGECVVVAREREGGLKALIAYLVPSSGATLSSQELRHELKRHLPDYMVPSAFVFLDRLPLTPSGKVDRRSLPAPEEAQTAPPIPAAGEKPWLPLQLQLVQIWQDILGVRPIGLRDNFFDLGGHSLLAVKMMDRVEQVTGKKVPVTELFQDATVAHLAEVILRAEETVISPVVELVREGSRPPIYFLHGDIIGGGFYARDLARLLGPDQPFFVLPPSGMSNGTLATVEEMSTIHLRDLRVHRPKGPYVLGGFCIGALIAYEMAVRLGAEGEPVPWVAMIDPQLPSRLLRAHFRATERRAARHGYSDEQKLAQFAKGYKVLYRLREEWNAPLSEKGRFLARKVRAVLSRQNGQEQEVELSEAAVPQNSGPAGGSFDDPEQRILAAFHWILSAYEPPRYQGNITMFLTDEQRELTPFLARSWRRVAPQLDLQRVPGKHLGAITTEVESFGATLRSRLLHYVPGETRPTAT